MELVCKPPLAASNSGQQIKYVCIFHPCDIAKGHEFLALPALDIFVSSIDPNERVTDVHHHRAALDMCHIIAGNQPGYFALLENNSAIPRTSKWLQAGDYIYHLDSCNNQYPIFVTFSLWKYPGAIPESWKAIEENLSTNIQCSKSSVSDVVKGRDETCRVSGTRHGLTSAHLVPPIEKEWFAANHMHDYCFNKGLMDDGVYDIANQIGMRVDLHTLVFDRGIFTIAVKDGRAVIHFLKADPVTCNELVPLFHNNEFNTDGIAMAFLYTRFAWSIFYEGNIHMTMNQQFLVTGEHGVLQNVKDYLAKLDGASEGPEMPDYEGDSESEDTQFEDG